MGARVGLIWSAPADVSSVTSYVIEAGSTPGGSDVAVFDTGSTVTGFGVNPPPGTYYVRVRGRLSGSVGLPTNEAVVTMPSGCTAPYPPTGLSHGFAGYLLGLSWQEASFATDYVVEAGSGPGLADMASIRTGGPHALTVRAPTGTYYVRVRGINTCGTGSPSNENMVVVGGCVRAPGALVATVSGPTVTLSWEAAVTLSFGEPTGYAIGYFIEAGSRPGATDVGQFNTGAVTSFAADAPNGTYYVRVRALSPCGTAPASNELVVTVSALH